MPKQKNSLQEAIGRVMALGDYALTAACRNEQTAFKILSELPYVKVNPPGWDVRSGTDAHVISNSILKDATIELMLPSGVPCLTPVTLIDASGIQSHWVRKDGVRRSTHSSVPYQYHRRRDCTRIQLRCARRAPFSPWLLSMEHS